VAASLAAATIAELRRHAPFDAMALADMEWLVGRLALVYFPPDATVLQPSEGVASSLYIVRQGAVNGADPQSAFVHFRLAAGESFPLGALLGKRATASVYRADGDTFCWRLGAADFETLLERSQPFRDFCTTRLANLLATSRRQMQRDYATLQTRDPLDQPLADVIARTPVYCDPEQTVSSVLGRMRDQGVGSMIVCDAGMRPLGIFTLRDLRDRVALAGLSPDARICDVMTSPPVTLPLDAPALEAALLMARHGFHHIVVTRDGELAGVVSEGDLFALRRVGMTAAGEAIRTARSIEQVAAAAGRVRALTQALLAQGVAAGQLTRVVSALNDLVAARVLEIECAAAGIAPDALCWLAFGSEGRHEQTLATDQDNGILFAGAGVDPAQQRERFLPLASSVNRALAQCGFALCKGEIMAGNPRWCLSLAEWKDAFGQWLREPDGDALLNAVIFFDFRPLWGKTALAAELRDWLTRTAGGHAVFLRLMAENALRNAPPLGVIRDFTLEQHGGSEDSIDIKLSGVTPFVDAARVLALAAGVPHTSTAERLRAVAAQRKLHAAETDAWIEAFEFVQAVRLQHQHARLRGGQAPDNYVQPDRLNDLDRRILKESFRQARKLQHRLRLDFRL
jgi:CBS domain-containing protein